MMETPGNESTPALFARIRQFIELRGVDIRVRQVGNALHLDFADGQRLLINLAPDTLTVWLAGSSGGTEFHHREGVWVSAARQELFDTLRERVEQLIAANPVNARAPQPAAVRPAPATAVASPPPAPARHTLRNVLLLLLTGVIALWLVARQLPHAGTGLLAALQPDPYARCDERLPANASVSMFPASTFRTDNPADPEITVRNDHRHTVLLILTAPHTLIPSASLLIQGNQSASLHLPPGDYDMMFSAGSRWCNAYKGFSEGHLIKLEQPLTVQPHTPVRLALQSTGSEADQFQLFVRNQVTAENLPAPTLSGDGKFTLQRHADGHFYVPGSVEQVSAAFIVDTGASVTSITTDLARQAGISNCKEMQFNTANGAASGCIALVSNMTLGSFELRNITVAVMPNMEVNLLGANVLRNFHVQLDESTMLIGRQ